MTFQEKLTDFRNWVARTKDSVKSEEATKTSLVMPFFQRVLGYDVFSPTEFVPEYKAGFGDKPSDRVDYTIIINGKPEIIIECKSVGTTLNHQHEAQLQGYFASLKARIAILTNGISYQFYTDIERANLLDNTPFMTFDVLNQDTSLFTELEFFCKDGFNASNIFEKARELKYSNIIRDFLTNQLICPSNDFVKLLISQIDGMEIHAEAVEELRPLVKKCFSKFVNEYPKNGIEQEQNENSSVNDTDNEIFTAIRECLKDIIDPVRISQYSSTKWTSIYYKNCILCRIITVGKPYCEIAFPEKFTDPSTNVKNRKIAITYSVDNAGEIENYRDDFISSINDIDTAYDKMYSKHQNYI